MPWSLARWMSDPSDKLLFLQVKMRQIMHELRSLLWISCPEKLKHYGNGMLGKNVVPWLNKNMYVSQTGLVRLFNVSYHNWHSSRLQCLHLGKFVILYTKLDVARHGFSSKWWLRDLGIVRLAASSTWGFQGHYGRGREKEKEGGYTSAFKFLSPDVTHTLMLHRFQGGWEM